MTRSRTRAQGLAPAAAALCLLAACADTVPPSRRSVVLVTLDTTRADRLGIYGGTTVPTPNLDRMASQGTVFDIAVSQAPLTLPSHASLLTGRYPSSLGILHNGIYRLPEGETTLAERLRDEGFDTAAFISSFVLNRGFGVEQGFDRFDDVPVDRFQGGRDRLFEAERTADAVNEQVFRWLAEREPANRFFLWVQYYDPHDPYSPPEVEGRELHGSGYDREISYVDACFGDLVERLGDRGVLDSTILIVAGDHGEGLGDHGENTHGLFLYEEAVRVPLFIRAPGLVPQGERVDGPVELVAVAATVLDLLGLDPIERAEGESLRPRIEGLDDGGDAVAYAATYMPRLDYGWSELTMIRDHRYKLVGAPTPELYDLRDDPGESVNLFHEEPERGERLAARLAGWVASTTDTAAETEASRTLSPEEEERLRSLGYLSGAHSTSVGKDDIARPDPKEMMGELQRFSEAQSMLDADEPLAALEIVAGILATNPGHHRARVTRILALMRLERLSEAEQEARDHVTRTESDPTSSGALREGSLELMASIYRLQGRPDEAEEHYRLILSLNPDSETAVVDFASFLMERGRLEESSEQVNAYLQRHPTSGIALALRLRLDEAAGDLEGALVTARLMADVRGGNPDALLRAAQILMRDDPGRAAVCLELALEILPPDPFLLGRLGGAQARAGRLEDAQRTLLAASSMQPSDPALQFQLGIVALELGDESEGRFRFDRALTLDPGFTRARTTLARWLARQGRDAEALEVARDAMERDPGSREAQELVRDLAP